MRAMLRMRFATAAFAIAVLASCDHYTAEGEPQLAPAPTVSGVAATAVVPGDDPTSVPAAPSCDSLRVAEPIVAVERFRTATGCTSAVRAVAYRCAPDLDPMITLDVGSSPTRYLGGRFAVPVPAVPEGAVELGAIAAGRVWILPSTPQSTLFVEDTTGVERWLPLPARGGIQAPPAAMVIGDSLLDGAQEELVAAMPSWTLAIDAEVGRSTSGAALVAESLLEPMPEVVVVEVAVNDHDPVAVRANLDRVVTATDHPQLLLWLTGHGPDAETDDVNRAIVAGMGEVARGAVLDWDRLVPEDALDFDGVHLLGDRQGEMADVIAIWLRAWHDAATGEGATGCEGVVRAAAKRAG
jgi:hypothetical protein